MSQAQAALPATLRAELESLAPADGSRSKRTPLIYSRSFSRGTLTLAAWHEGSAELELHGWPRIPEYDLIGLTVGVQTVLELSGRRSVAVSSTRRAPLVILRATWGR